MIGERQPGVGFPSSSKVLVRVLPSRNDANGYYEFLGLEPGSGIVEVKRAYRRLARKFHPDGQEPDVEKFHYLQHIFETLSDSEVKHRYDRTKSGMTFLSEWEKRMLRGMFNDFVTDAEEGDKEELFSYYGDREHSELAQRWYEVILDQALHLGIRRVWRVSIEHGNSFLFDRKSPFPIVRIGQSMIPTREAALWIVLS